MYHPEWRAEQSHVLDEDSVTLVEVDELRAQTILGTEAALIHVDAVLCHLEQTRAASVALAYDAFFPSVAGSATPFPPCFVFAASIDGSFACDCHVSSLISIDTR